MSKPVLLLYDPLSSPWVGKVKQTCAVQGLRLRVLEGADLGRPLSVLAMGLAGEGASPDTPPVPEPMLIFCGLPEGNLDRMLSALRRMGVPRTVLKAVLTPHNAGWTVRALYTELCSERAALSRPGAAPEHTPFAPKAD